MPATGGGWTTATDHGKLGPASISGDRLQVTKSEPRCLRQRGSILIPTLNNELTPDWMPRGISPSSKKPQLKKKTEKE